MIVSNTLNVKEILKIYFIEQKIYPNHQDEQHVDYYSDLSWYVSDCTVCDVFVVFVRYSIKIVIQNSLLILLYDTNVFFK